MSILKKVFMLDMVEGFWGLGGFIGKFIYIIVHIGIFSFLMILLFDDRDGRWIFCIRNIVLVIIAIPMGWFLSLLMALCIIGILECMLPEEIGNWMVLRRMRRGEESSEGKKRK